MSKKELAAADYLDWSSIAAAWGEAYDRTGSPNAKARHRIAKARAEAAKAQMETR